MPAKAKRRVASPKAKGGYIQRIAAAATPTPPSHLVQWLLEKHWWGQLPATSIQEVAQAAFADGLRHPDITRFGPAHVPNSLPPNLGSV